jgi:hypothetical protein
MPVSLPVASMECLDVVTDVLGSLSDSCSGTVLANCAGTSKMWHSVIANHYFIMADTVAALPVAEYQTDSVQLALLDKLEALQYPAAEHIVTGVRVHTAQLMRSLEGEAPQLACATLSMQVPYTTKVLMLKWRRVAEEDATGLVYSLIDGQMMTSLWNDDHQQWAGDEPVSPTSADVARRQEMQRLHTLLDAQGHSKFLYNRDPPQQRIALQSQFAALMHEDVAVATEHEAAALAATQARERLEAMGGAGCAVVLKALSETLSQHTEKHAFDVFQVSVTHAGFEQNQATCVDMWWSRGADLAPTAVAINGTIQEAPVRKLAAIFMDEPETDEPETASPELESALSSSGLGFEEPAAPPTAVLEPVQEAVPQPEPARVYVPEPEPEPAEDYSRRRAPSLPEPDPEPEEEPSEEKKQALADKEAYMAERAARQGSVEPDLAEEEKAKVMDEALKEEANRIAQSRGYANIEEMKAARGGGSIQNEEPKQEPKHGLTDEERADAAREREAARLRQAAEDDKAAFLAERAAKKAAAADA